MTNNERSFAKQQTTAQDDSGGRVIFVFGNPDVEIDSLPLKILPELKTALPNIKFEVHDPNEEWDIPDDFIVIDTVLGIDDVTVFDDLEAFAAAPRVSLHDFDALANLRLMQKLGKLNKIKIIGIPPMISKEVAMKKIVTLFLTF
ncbi:MAG: hypothetical protein ABIA47_01210 [bacterium]